MKGLAHRAVGVGVDTVEGARLWITAGFLVGIALTGAAVAVMPLAGVGLAGCLAGMGLLWLLADTKAASLLVFASLAVVSVVDLPRRVVVGPITMYAWMSVALAILLIAISASRYVLSALKGTGLTFLPLYAFGGWALLSMVWFKPSLAGTQNVVIYAAFAALAPTTAAVTIRRDVAVETVRSAITAAIIVGSSLYCLSLAAGGLGGEAVVGSRSYALFGVIGVAWGVANARFGRLRYALLAAACWLLILLSLSRLGFAAATLILIAGAISFQSTPRTLRSICLVVAFLATAYICVTSFGPLASRFNEGDLRTVAGGVSVNTEGRARLWEITWKSYLESPIIGKGVGSAEAEIGRVEGQPNHPHNDYLRILHDLGIIGLGLLSAAFISFLISAIGAMRRHIGTTEEMAIHFAAILATIGLMIGMTTDNAIVYLFVVGPVAVIVGLSVGIRFRRPARRPARSIQMRRHAAEH